MLWGPGWGAGLRPSLWAQVRCSLAVRPGHVPKPFWALATCSVEGARKAPASQSGRSSRHGPGRGTWPSSEGVVQAELGEGATVLPAANSSPGWKPEGPAGAGPSRLSGRPGPGGRTHSSWGAAGSCSSWLPEGGAGCTVRTHSFPPSCSGSRSGGRSGREASDSFQLLAGGRTAPSRTPLTLRAGPPQPGGGGRHADVPRRSRPVRLPAASPPCGIPGVTGHPHTHKAEGREADDRGPEGRPPRARPQPRGRNLADALVPWPLK